MAAAGAWVSVEPNHGQEENEPDSTVQDPGACLAWCVVRVSCRSTCPHAVRPIWRVRIAGLPRRDDFSQMVNFA